MELHRGAASRIETDWLEVMMVGGFSIVASLCFWLFVDRQASLYAVSQVAFLAAFAVNHPHFLSSYLLLYGDFRSKILRSPRFFWAAVVSPLLLGGALVYALARRDAATMAHLITLMFLLVGWHYVKQVFGCVVVSSARRKIYFGVLERRALLTNLVCVWMWSWTASHVGPGPFAFYGILHDSLRLPPWTLTVVSVATVASLLGVLAIFLRKYVREGVKPPVSAVAAFFALYVWYIPVLVHPAYGYFIPLFHSLQYLTFVIALNKGRIRGELAEFSRDSEAWRRGWVVKAGSFAFLALGLGALAFEFVPKGLDGMQWIPAGTLGDAPFLAAFLLFINIHHYFIDNAIWRSNNETVRKHLFTSDESNNLKIAG